VTTHDPPRLDDHPLVTDGMQRSLGVWDEWGPWSAPIRDSDIRRWALAVYWPEAPPRKYWDNAIAAATPAGRLVAPEDFNPFAWPAPAPTDADSDGPRDRTDRLDRRPDLRKAKGRVNGGCRVTYGVAMRSGDRIRRRVRLHGWRTADATRGPLLLVDYEHEWRNERNELVRAAVYTLIHW
jgi:hypothetical protein